MTPLSPADNMFLLIEKRQQPTHIAGLQLFDFPEDAPDNFVTQLAEELRSYKDPVRPFNQRLVYRFGRPYWENDKQFDLEHHFRHVSLPKPGRIRELLSFVSTNHSNQMDRDRPLWEYYLVEGVEGRRFAIYSKQHHALMDGVSGMRLANKILTQDPNQRGLPPAWAAQSETIVRPKLDPTDPTPISEMAALFGNVKKTFSSVRRVYRALDDAYSQSHQSTSSYTSIFQAPDSLLNQPITGSRRFAAQSYSMERIRVLAKAYHATINDVVLAICGGALRDYLLAQRALPEQPLIAAIPVSIRDDDSSIGGNEIVTILANLGTHIADPVVRMRVIKNSVKDAKERLASMSKQEIMAYTAFMLFPASIHTATGLMPKWRAFNVLISNVPGPKQPLYWNGARLTGMYPVSMPLDRQALNITILSYYDQLEFGLTACRRTLPSMQRMLNDIETSIQRLEMGAGIARTERNIKEIA